MSTPARQLQFPEETPHESPPGESLRGSASEAEVRALLNKIKAEHATDSHPIERPKPAPRVSPPLVSVTKLLSHDLFLSLLVLTALNAFIYVHYNNSAIEGLDLRSSNNQLRDRLSDNAQYLDPIIDFVSYHGEFPSTSSQIFQASLRRFREKMAFLGTDPSQVFLRTEFFPKNGGLYWSSRLGSGKDSPEEVPE